MTMAHERARALRWAGELLREIRQDTTVSVGLRKQIKAVLRHYPSAHEIDSQAGFEKWLWTTSRPSAIGEPWLTSEDPRFAPAFIPGAIGKLVINPDHPAAPALARLLAVFRTIFGSSEATGEENVEDVGWLDSWIATPALALDGATPLQLLDTPDGIETVERVLGAILSGSYL